MDFVTNCKNFKLIFMQKIHEKYSVEPIATEFSDFWSLSHDFNQAFSNFRKLKNRISLRIIDPIKMAESENLF